MCAGPLLLITGWVLLLRSKGTQMSHRDVEAMGRIRGPGATWSDHKLRGWTVGIAADDSFGATQSKAACRSGAALRDPVWRRRLITLIGGMLTALAGFGIAVVLVPVPFLKVVFAGAILYALVRTSWMLYRA